MNKDIQQLLNRASDYLSSILGIKFKVNEDNDSHLNLPYYLKSGNTFVVCTLDGHNRLLVIPSTELPDGSTITKRMADISSRTDLRPILVIENIDSVRRKHLINNRTEFIVPGKQVYLPSMGSFLTERGLAQGKTVERKCFSPAAQVLLLYHLQKVSFDGQIISAVAEKIPYSIKTISSAVKELEQAGVCVVIGDNSGKRLQFIPKNKIWHEAYHLLNSPIQEVLFCDNIEMIPAGIRYASYDEALSQYTFMAESDRTAFAVYKNGEVVKKLKGDGFFNKVEGKYRVELWKYNPALLAKGDTVDALSLALCYKDSDDERVIAEIEKLIERTCED